MKLKYAPASRADLFEFGIRSWIGELSTICLGILAFSNRPVPPPEISGTSLKARPTGSLWWKRPCAKCMRKFFHLKECVDKTFTCSRVSREGQNEEFIITGGSAKGFFFPKKLAEIIWSWCWPYQHNILILCMCIQQQQKKSRLRLKLRLLIPRWETRNGEFENEEFLARKADEKNEKNEKMRDKK